MGEYPTIRGMIWSVRGFLVVGLDNKEGDSRDDNHDMFVELLDEYQTLSQ